MGPDLGGISPGFGNRPIRGVIRVVKKFQNSRFTQDIILYPGVPRVDCAMQVDWHEKRILLKVAFPISVSSRTASTRFLRRYSPATTRETPVEKAKFEVPALRWADLPMTLWRQHLEREQSMVMTPGQRPAAQPLRSPTWLTRTRRGTQPVHVLDFSAQGVGSSCRCDAVTS